MTNRVWTTDDDGTPAHWEESPGGSQPATQTLTIDTDPDTFTGEVIVDLGHPTVVGAVFSFVSSVPDGETFGVGSGDLVVFVDSPITSSLDGIAFTTVAYTGGFAPDPGFGVYTATPGPGHEMWNGMACQRYLKLRVALQDDQGNPYVGANHPTAHLSVTVTYL